MTHLSEAEMIRQLTDAGVDVSAVIGGARDVWTLEVWNTIPGPGPEDIIATFNSRSEFVRAFYRYHLGSPSEIDGWIVSLHKHPELTPDGVRYAITQAVSIAPEDFEHLAKDRWKRTIGNYRLGKTRWEWALQAQFIPCYSLAESDLTLQLRRDMHEAYVIQDAE